MDSTELNSTFEIPAETLAVLAEISHEINSSLNLDEVLASADSLLAVGCFCIGVNQVDLVAANRARIQHAEEPRLVQPIDERHREPPQAFGPVRGGGDRLRQIARPRQRVGSPYLIHAPS